jgi:hypothetical protein
MIKNKKQPPLYVILNTQWKYGEIQVKRFEISRSHIQESMSDHPNERGYFQRRIRLEQMYFLLKSNYEISNPRPRRGGWGREECVFPLVSDNFEN